MDTSVQKAQAFIIKNTKKQKRPNNILEIADNINYLIENLGSLEKVSKETMVSAEMLSCFLKVDNLNQNVKNLVEQRKIDSVTVVKYLSKFNKDEQQYIANEVINGNLNSIELRYIYPLRTKLPGLTIQELVKKHNNSKNIEISKAIVEISDNSITEEYLSEIFTKIIGKENLVSIIIENKIGVLKVTKKGETYLKEFAKKENLTLKQLMNKILNDKEYARYK